MLPPRADAACGVEAGGGCEGGGAEGGGDDEGGPEGRKSPFHIRRRKFTGCEGGGDDDCGPMSASSAAGEGDAGLYMHMCIRACVRVHAGVQRSAELQP